MVRISKSNPYLFLSTPRARRYGSQIASGPTSQGSGFRGVRSRTRVLQEPVRLSGTFPEWEFDGSSTGDIDSGNSDLLLKCACFFIRDHAVRGCLPPRADA